MAQSRPPLCWTIRSIICCSRLLQPTPPTIRTSFWPQCAMARSVISTNMANSVSCSEKQRSALLISFLASRVLASCSTLVRIPENDTSIPFTTYGRSRNCVPFFASCSMLYPGEGSLDKPITLANRSKQLPMAMSILCRNGSFW